MIHYKTFGSLENLKIFLNDTLGEIDIIAISGTTVWYTDINVRLLAKTNHEYARN